MSPYLKNWLLNTLLALCKIAFLTAIFVFYRFDRIKELFENYPQLMGEFIFFLIGVAGATQFPETFYKYGKDKRTKEG